MPARKTIHVKAIWDDEAKVWVAESDDVPGLITEASAWDRLMEKLRVLILELLEANGMLEESDESEIPFHLRSEQGNDTLPGGLNGGFMHPRCEEAAPSGELSL